MPTAVGSASKVVLAADASVRCARSGKLLTILDGQDSVRRRAQTGVASARGDRVVYSGAQPSGRLTNVEAIPDPSCRNSRGRPRSNPLCCLLRLIDASA